MRQSLIAPRVRGFTLVELAVVLTIVAFLLASLMYTFSAQVDQRNIEETRRRLEQARELVLSYAQINGRLPCPARSVNTAAPVTVTGDEVRDAAGNCVGDAVTDYYGGTNLGLLPARTIGMSQIDPAGFALDAWGNRIRYAVSNLITACSGTSTTCQPNDLLICKSATGITATACGGATNQIMSQSLVVAIVYSTGKNSISAQDAATANGLGRTDEAANLNGDRVFVFHPPTPSDSANGEFDDHFTWITVGELYGRLIAAGMLP